MPTVHANTSDGKVTVGPVGTWTAARDATSGTATTTGQGDSSAVGGNAISARGGGTNFNVKRSFFEFNFTGVTNVDAATLKVKNPGSAQSTVRVVKAGNFAPLASGDFDNIDGFSAGNTMAGNVTDYIDSPILIAANTTTDITLNAAAISAMNSNDKFLIAIVGNTYDYLNVTPSPGDNNIGGIQYADTPGTTDDPRIEYTETAASARSAQAGGDFTREELRTKQLVSTAITADTDFEFKFENNLKNMVYFNIEGVNGKDIFNTASLRTTASDSGSNVLTFISESQHVSFILAGESTSSFFMSSSEDISGNNMKVMATNIESINPESSSFLGVKMDLLA